MRLLVQRAIEVFRRYLTAQGLRLTPTRLQVLRAAWRQRGAFGPEHIVETAMLAGQDVSRATVYRNLPHLEEAGIVKRMERPGEPLRWVLASRPEPGVGDLVCVGCGLTVGVSLAPVEQAAERLCAAHGFSMTATVSRLHGLCRRCRDVTSG